MNHKMHRPTDAEIEILQILWEQGDCTVREVHEKLNQTKTTIYTTTLKTMQRMFQKGLVSRNEDSRHHIYSAILKEEPTRKLFILELLARFFGNSTSELVLQALSAKKASPEEIREIENIIQSLKKRE
ncbi:MAG: BlaI/MecI/CopY family transcriptional regulator [Candidatus Omnitrophica bacterium]|nr:BlaI/MecI/CopY family transcriptional regulator [Candidatus Omnitrophota bacterium]